MNTKLKEKLIDIAKQKISNDDPSHDFLHALRVLAVAEQIAKEEKADLDIVVPAALFHDLVSHPKNNPRSKDAPHESAELAGQILKEINEFPQKKVENVQIAIRCCSYSQGIVPELLEAKILQDADGLEAMGAISIMRTFSSTGSMKRLFYDYGDPFCKDREPDDLRFALDLFFTRLLKVKDRMHTKTAMKMAKRRTLFLKKFLSELELELKGK